MKVMGLRASAQEIRYALLEKDKSGDILFVNKDNENKLICPATIDSVDQKLLWIKREIERILRQNNDIGKIVLKMNEYTGTENGAKRETTYVDSIFLIVAAESNIPIVRKLNSQIGSTSAKAKELAENRIGKTDKYWNNTMADAILAAYNELRGA